MNITQEAAIGKSMLMAFPNRMIEIFFEIANYEPKLRRQWYDFIDKHLYSSDANASWSYKEGGLTLSEKWHYFSLINRLTVAFKPHDDDPLNRKYWLSKEKYPSPEAFITAMRKPWSENDFWSEDVSWVTPHLAGLPKTHAESLLTDFRYDAEQRTYHLSKVKKFVVDNGRKSVVSVHFFRLVWLFIGELDRIDSGGKSEGNEFHMFVKRLARSGVKKEEKLSRYSRALLEEFDKARKQMQNLSSTS